MVNNLEAIQILLPHNTCHNLTQLKDLAIQEAFNNYQSLKVDIQLNIQVCHNNLATQQQATQLHLIQQLVINQHMEPAYQHMEPPYQVTIQLYQPKHTPTCQQLLSKAQLNKPEF